MSAPSSPSSVNHICGESQSIHTFSHRLPAPEVPIKVTQPGAAHRQKYQVMLPDSKLEMEEKGYMLI